MNANLVILEYSPSQGAFHVETSRELVRTNLLALKGGKSHDFLTVWIFNSWDDYDRDCPKIKEKVLKWLEPAQIPQAG